MDDFQKVFQMRVLTAKDKPADDDWYAKLIAWCDKHHERPFRLPEGYSQQDLLRLEFIARSENYWREAYWDLMHHRGGYYTYLNELNQKQAGRIMELEHELRRLKHGEDKRGHSNVRGLYWRKR